MTELNGYRIWEVDEKTRVPKQIEECNGFDPLIDAIKRLDLVNKTYAIRMGKTGLK